MWYEILSTNRFPEPVQESQLQKLHVSYRKERNGSLTPTRNTTWEGGVKYVV